MNIFWKPKGMPVRLQALKDGQHVEGYYKGRFDSLWRRTKDAVIRIEQKNEMGYRDNYVQKRMYILIRGDLGKKSVGRWYGEDFLEDSDYRFRLYDGCRYTKPRRRRILP